jgi:hypothetical protein
MPFYYDDCDCFLDIMRHAIVLNGSFQYLQDAAAYLVKAYF